MIKAPKLLAFAAIAVSGLAVAPAVAQNPGFEYADLVLGFQATGGFGSGNYLLARIGQSGLLRDAGAPVSLLNIGAELTLAFGSNWYERTDLFMGVSAIGSNDEFNGFLLNGDPDVTPYIGLPRQSVGLAGEPASFAPNLNGAATQSAASAIFAAHSFFEAAGTGPVSSISKGSNLTDYDDQNPITAGVQGTAYDVFAGGVQVVLSAGLFGNIGGVNAEAALDLYRIQRFNNIPGQFGLGDPTDIGTYEGTIVIDNTGQVGLVVGAIPEPTTLGLLSAGVTLMGFSRRRRDSKG